jgi:2-haloacid dehalogenase
VSERKLEHLVFDLDDTLLDTSRQLMPRAVREAVEAMITVGLKTDFEAARLAWKEFSQRQSAPSDQQDVFTYLIERFGVNSSALPTVVAKRGYSAFYNRKVESDIALFPGAREMLIELSQRYPLYLVTAGTKTTQEEKIEILKIAEYFKSISHVDPSQGQRKSEAFAAIHSRGDGHNPSPSSYLSIGNRIDSDIADAKRLGWTTCWVCYGEHTAMVPSNAFETPDFIIDNIIDLVRTCRL